MIPRESLTQDDSRNHQRVLALEIESWTALGEDGDFLTLGLVSDGSRIEDRK